MSKTHSIIFGLTADPIHKGHEQAIINGILYLQKLNISINKFILVPVYIPNLIAEKKSPIASYNQRIAMCELVAKRLSLQLMCQIQVSNIEKIIANETGKKNYSFYTIKRLNYTNSLFMVSSDHFQGRWPKFRQWYKWKEILAHSGLLINRRPGCKINENYINQLRLLNTDIYIVDSEKQVDISSSRIRQNSHEIHLQKNINDDVKSYIIDHNIYSNLRKTL